MILATAKARFLGSRIHLPIGLINVIDMSGFKVCIYVKASGSKIYVASRQDLWQGIL